jgi:hypothetical protein
MQTNGQKKQKKRALSFEIKYAAWAISATSHLTAHEQGLLSSEVNLGRVCRCAHCRKNQPHQYLDFGWDR